MKVQTEVLDDAGEIPMAAEHLLRTLEALDMSPLTE